jgi:glycogen debranching enzyme
MFLSGILMKLRTHLEPFSSFGSWFSICQQTPRKYVTCSFGEGVYVRCHHGKGIEPNEVFKLEILRHGQVVEAEVEADASEMRFTTGEGSMRVVFDAQGGLRFRGDKLGLRFRAPGWVAYSEAPELFTVNATKFERRFQFECLVGNLQWDAPWTGKRCAHIRLDLIPDESGNCEVALEECTSTRVPSPDRDPYPELRKRSEADFRDFCSSHGEGTRDPELNETWIRSLYVNWSSCVRPEGLLTRTTMLMSKHWMDRVWSWDHCFNAQALIHGKEGLAWDQLMLMFDHQDAFGALPDSVTDTTIPFNFSKPPVHGWTVRCLLEACGTRPDRTFLETLYSHLARHTDWFLTHRRRTGMALPYYLHGNDSGWDNSTMFAEGVPLVAPDLAALLVVQTEVLSELASGLGKTSESEDWTRTSQGLQEGLMELWNGSCFLPRRIHEGRELVPVECRSLIPYIPIFLGDRLDAEIRKALAAGIEAFITEYGVATEHPGSERYEPDGYWRGPIWAPSTVLIVYGLADSGYTEMAGTIARRFCNTCRRSGFAENFNALTGEGLRDRAYTWTSSAFQMLARRFLL